MSKMSSPAKGSNGNGCQHHWCIGEARGEYSTGVCRYCGEQQEFKNWLPALHLASIPVEKTRKGGKSRRGNNAIPNWANAAQELAEIRG